MYFKISLKNICILGNILAGGVLKEPVQTWLLQTFRFSPGNKNFPDQINIKCHIAAVLEPFFPTFYVRLSTHLPSSLSKTLLRSQ